MVTNQTKPSTCALLLFVGYDTFDVLKNLIKIKNGGRSMGIKCTHVGLVLTVVSPRGAFASHRSSKSVLRSFSSLDEAVSLSITNEIHPTVIPFVEKSQRLLLVFNGEDSLSSETQQQWTSKERHSCRGNVRRNRFFCCSFTFKRTRL
jgi:hypothetical protein